MIYKFRIIVPSGVLLDCDASIATMPGEDGLFSVLKDHEPLIANLKPGIIKVSSGDRILRYFVYDGIAKINNTEVNVITKFSVDIESVNQKDILDKISAKKSELFELSDKSKISILEHQICRYKDLLNCLQKNL